MINVYLLHRAPPLVRHALLSPRVAHLETLVHLTMRLGTLGHRGCSQAHSRHVMPRDVFSCAAPLRGVRHLTSTAAQDSSGWGLADQVASCFKLGCSPVWRAPPVFRGRKPTTTDSTILLYSKGKSAQTLKTRIPDAQKHHQTSSAGSKNK